MRHLLATAMVAALLASSGGAVGAQEADSDPEASPTPEQLAEAEERLATAQCLGKPVTIVAIAGFETLGTSGADVIVGTEGDDIIRGEGGDDRICSGPGADMVEGGAGKDRIDGGIGDDTLDGGAGNDIINGGKGADMVLGAAGNDRLSGAGGNDTLDGGTGNDLCKGGPGHDWLPGCNDKNRTKGKLVIRKNTTLKGPHRGFIVIDADRVTLDCGGHTVLGPGGGYGILLEGRQRVTVENCEVTNFNQGIRVTESQRNTLTRNFTHGNAQHGMHLNSSEKNKVIWNVSADDGVGQGATAGFAVWFSHRNVFKHNSVTDSRGAGFGIEEGSRNTFSENTVDGGNGGFIISGSRHTFHANVVTGALYGGFASERGGNHKFTANSVTGAVHEPAFNMGGYGDTFDGNVANDNQYLGFRDNSVPGANTYANNICLRNRGGGSQPEGLCDDTVPVEPEASPEPGDGSDSDEAPAAEE